MIRLGLMISALLFLLAGCDENAPPEAFSASFSTLEEVVLTGRLRGSDPEGDPLTYYVGTSDNGHIGIDPKTGDFLFEPHIDFYGTASFSFLVSDGKSISSPATILVTVENVNDRPTLAPIPRLQNSPDVEIVDYFVNVFDPDPEGPHLSVTVADPSVAEASVDQSDGRLSLRALRLGTTPVTIVAADAESHDTVTFDFAVDEVTKTRIVPVIDPENGAIVLTNTADRTVNFNLTHNGFPTFEGLDGVVAHVQSMLEEFIDEPFERKLWRFVRNSIYHELPLTTKRWLYDPWVTLNSLGWGLCGHAASTYVEIARAAGYEARVWALEGHVVPEIRVNGEWQMYDPDIAVYYWTEDDRIASVDDLAANPTLITNPVNPLFDTSRWQLAYTHLVADIYSSTDDNVNGEHLFVAPEQTPSSRVFLPGGSRLTYPGRWTEAPTIQVPPDSYEAPHFRQALLELPAGWTGTVTLPWMAWEVLGVGAVGIDGITYTVGSPELRSRLRDTTQPITSLDVYTSDSVAVVFFVNAVRYDITWENRIDVSGFDVWAIDASPVTPPPEQGAGAFPAGLAKPLPTDASQE